VGNGKTVAVDFDGVLCVPYHGPPLSGTEALLQGLHDRGYTVAIHTCNKPERVWKWLAVYGWAHLVDYVSNNKPPAILYIDDRGFRYQGKSSSAQAVFAFLDSGPDTWWEKEGMKPEWTHDMVHPSSNAIQPVRKGGAGQDGGG